MTWMINAALRLLLISYQRCMLAGGFKCKILSDNKARYV